MCHGEKLAINLYLFLIFCFCRCFNDLFFRVFFKLLKQLVTGVFIKTVIESFKIIMKFSYGCEFFFWPSAY